MWWKSKWCSDIKRIQKLFFFLGVKLIYSKISRLKMAQEMTSLKVYLGVGSEIFHFYRNGIQVSTSMIYKKIIIFWHKHNYIHCSNNLKCPLNHLNGQIRRKNWIFRKFKFFENSKVSRMHIFDSSKIINWISFKMVNFDQPAGLQPSPKAYGARTSVFWQENRISGSKSKIYW